MGIDPDLFGTALHFKARPRPRGRAILPAGFIRPCQSILATKIPLGPEWIHEVKHDGYRLICRRAPGNVKLWTRTATDWATKFTAIREGIEALPPGCVIDGEAVCDFPDGRNDFHSLFSKWGCARANLWAFDLLVINGEDIRSQPLEDRRARLKALIDGVSPAIHFSGSFDGPEGQKVLDLACGYFEGIVSKRLGSRYRSGPTDNWRKVKCKDYRRDTA